MVHPAAAGIEVRPPFTTVKATFANRSLCSHLKPGAWFEIGELGTMAFSDDNSVPEDWPPKLCLDYVRGGLQKLGRIFPTGEWLEELLVEAGFEDVKVSSN